jgi:hypothetical protein
MEEFFQRLGKNANIREAFEFATAKTETFTRKGGDANTENRFYDDASQHPLLDDDGDGKGSNSFSTTGDGQKAKDILLGIGLNYDTNFAGSPAEILRVSKTIYLSASETGHFDWSSKHRESRRVQSRWATVSDYLYRRYRVDLGNPYR